MGISVPEFAMGDELYAETVTTSIPSSTQTNAVAGIDV